MQAFPDAAMPLSFQRLTDEDRAKYGRPGLVVLDPPQSTDPIAACKRRNWIRWRAASYAAERHSEYLWIPDVDGGVSPRILISAVLGVPESTEEYLRAIPRKNRYTVQGKKALARSYAAQRMNPVNESAGIHAIIHSSTERQGRPIAPMFRDRPPDYDFPEYRPTTDPNYEDICCGVYSANGRLAAYLLGKRVGEHVQYDEIMAHAADAPHDVMYLLHFFFLQQAVSASPPPSCLNYGPWYSGVNPFSPLGGLNRWKRKVGFKPAYLILASSSADRSGREPPL